MALGKKKVKWMEEKSAKVMKVMFPMYDNLYSAIN